MIRVWLRKESHKTFRELSPQAQAVIGLLSMGVEDLDEIAGLLMGKASYEAKRRLAEIVSVSPNPVIMRCKIHPPDGMVAEIKKPIRCPICGNRVFFVPCQFCCCIPDSVAYTDVQDDAPTSSRPTRFLPGTPGKLMVLAARAALGESLWHPEDGRWPWPLRGGRVRCLGDILTRCQETEEEFFCVPEDETGPDVDAILT